MSVRIQDNIRKTGYDPGENRGGLAVICTTYCIECVRVFMGDNSTDKICKK